ncbi:hypothetical protein SAMN05444410_1087 [Hydrobacter penzbergensis]|uniref:Uncharacterized protein n=1 Tax=Hydrobacter penzbergensis TaxID=1235997 RepID=A0A8X8LF91_9BACT|nr:hypothetical protein [Hydrobacter penzbergensis]SDX00259.1 hypothetical protein SAMN05444410_1087 [Hydrobacter penzbergensis]
MKKLILLVFLFLPTSRLFSQCYVTSFGSLGTLFKSTGNYQLDQKFNISKTTLENLFNISVNLFIYDDGQSPNAYAKRSDDQNYDGLVAFGRNMLVQRLWNIERGEFAVAGILAHECAHVIQIKKGTYYSVTKLKELHADFMAGYFIGTQGFPQNGINAFANDLYSIGDYDFWAPDHHGTPEERVAAMLAGFQVRNSSASSAYMTGLSYVRGDRILTTGGGLGSGTTNPQQQQPQRTRVVPCTHLVHPNGDIIPCSHILHPNGDVYPCSHACPGPYGPIPCHPYGDIGQCSHRVHNSDVISCTHILHPNGDIINY